MSLNSLNLKSTLFSGSSSSEVSQRLSLLQQILVDAGSRTLVFVETKKSAKFLAKHLGQTKPELSPRVVVGQYGVNAMSWEGEGGQREAIADFNSGRCKVLVATAVVEEGLDISDCDSVIVFEMPLNLIR